MKTFINPTVDITEVKNNIIATSETFGFGDGTVDEVGKREFFYDFPGELR